MPKIGTRFAALPNGKTVECVLYYMPKQGYEEAYFAVTAINPEFIIQDHPMLHRVSLRSSSFLGTTGTTEKEALEKFEAYLADYEKSALTKVNVIYLKIDDAQNNDSYWGKNDQQVNINFKYVVGYYIDISGERIYYETEKDRAGKRSDQKMYHPEREYTIIPFTEQALERCKEIIKQFIAINDKLKTLFETPDIATKTLLTTKNLLTDDSTNKH